MKEGTIQYIVKAEKRGKNDAPEYAIEFTIRLRPYNEKSLDDLNFSSDLLDTGLIKKLKSEVKEKLKNNAQYSATAEESYQFPEFQEEKPILREITENIPEERDILKDE